MLTPWGKLEELDLGSTELCTAILVGDKHQLAEGLVVENLFDQIIEAVPARLPGALTLDIETAVARANGPSDRWYAFVWSRSRQPGLGRYLQALERRFDTWFAELDGQSGTFVGRRWTNGGLTGRPRPLPEIMQELSGSRPRPLVVDSAVRDGGRQQASIRGFLSAAYGDQLGPKVALSRLFFNYGVQPWFRAVWNVDRILIAGDDIWALEIKHKFPINRARLQFGINDGELGVLSRLSEAGIRCFHTILVKPDWDKNRGSGYLLSRLDLKERAALIGTELTGERISSMFRSAGGVSASHTTFSGQGILRYRQVNADAFVRLGVMADRRDELAGALGDALQGRDLPQVADAWLRQLRSS